MVHFIAMSHRRYMNTHTVSEPQTQAGERLATKQEQNTLAGAPPKHRLEVGTRLTATAFELVGAPLVQGGTYEISSVRAEVGPEGYEIEVRYRREGTRSQAWVFIFDGSESDLEWFKAFEMKDDLIDEWEFEVEGLETLKL